MAAAVSARHRVRSVHLCATGSAGEEQVSWLWLFAAQVAQLSLIACEAHYDMVVKLGTFHCTGLYGVQALCQPFSMCYRRCMQRSCLFRHILVLFFLHTASMHTRCMLWCHGQCNESHPVHVAHVVAVRLLKSAAERVVGACMHNRLSGQLPV